MKSRRKRVPLAACQPVTTRADKLPVAPETSLLGLNLRTSVKRGRRAFSLIELLAVISATTVLFGLATGLLISLMQVDRSWREQVRAHATIVRLADQFRRDVHSAERMKSLPAAADKLGPGWQLGTGPDRTVEYRFSAGRFVRAQRADGKTVQQEEFRLPGEAAVTMRLPDAAGSLVGLEIVPLKTPGDLSSFGPLEIVAVLGRDQRFSGRQGP